jgi:hypothetical protein
MQSITTLKRMNSKFTPQTNSIDLLIDKKEYDIHTDDCLCIIDEVDFVKIIDKSTQTPLPVMETTKKPTTQLFLIPTVLFSLLLVFGWNVGLGQTSITNTSTITESFTGYAGTSTLPTNWATTGGGTNGNSFQGTNQSGGTSGGWYGNGNMSYLGSGSANNGRATWKLQNNTGSSITGFNLSYTARMWRSNTSASPTVRVYYIVSSSSTFPTNNETGWTELTSLSFSDATSNISSGTTKTQNNVSASVSNGNYIYLRWIHSGGSNSDNLGWDEINFSANAATPTISSSGSLSALSTTYGTVSSNTSFNVSGANMTAGILVTPPAGFEVSTSASSGFATSITVGAAGTIASTTVYVRLAATTAPGTYSGNVVLSSSGASNVNVATVSSSVNTKALTISGLIGANKVYDATTTASSTGTPSLVGIVGGDAVTLSGTPNLTFANANVGTAKAITVMGYTLSGAQAARYTLTQPTGLTGDITTQALTVTADNVTKTAGSPLTGGSGSTAFSSSGLVGGQTIGSVTIAYGSAGAATGDGAAPGVYPNQVTPSAATGGTFTASNYAITYVQGSITVEDAPASPTISVSGSLSGLSTTYGTPSATTSFTVSGAAMTAGITITPPTSFEVATSSDFSTTIGTNSSPLVIGSAGTIPNTTIYVRIRAVATVAGSPYSGNITLTSTGASSENIATASSTVSTKTLTISGLTAANKVYDGNTTVSVTGTPTYVGLANSESFSVTGSPTFAFATKTVGTGKTINQTGSYSAQSTNYTVTQPILTADITAKTLTTIGATAENKVYDGNTTATITETSLVGLESGDVVSVSGGGTFANANVADGISVTASLLLSGSDAGNYFLSQPTGLTASITKANQTITFGTLADKATTDSPFLLTATASSGLIVTYTSSNSSVATVSGSTLTIVGAGSTTITASQAGNSNYNAASSVDQIQIVTLGGYYWNGGSTSANPANGGTGTWGNANSWRQPTATGSSATWSNSNTAIFAGTAGTVTIGSNYTPTTVYVNTTNYTLTPDGTTTRTILGNIQLAENVDLRLNDLTQTSNRTISIGGNISGGTNSKLIINVNQTGTNTSRINLGSIGATLSIPVEIGVGSTSLNFGNFAIVGTALNTVLSSTFSLTNNTNYITTIGATSGSSLTVNGSISGSSGLMFAAGSSGGAGIINLNGTLDYSGKTQFRFSNTGVVRASKPNVFPTTTELDLGNGANLGTFDLNGFNQEVAGLSSTSNLATRGIVNTGSAATFTLSGAGDYVLNSLTGIGIPVTPTNLTSPNNDISIVKTGIGTQEFQSILNYTGLTTVSGGTLRFNCNTGSTIPAGNNVLVNGGILRISTNQTLNNVTVSSGTLLVDSGVTLTINGTFTGGGTIENNGTIVIVGPSTFPGSGSTVSAMNNLTINRASGVTLNNSITITGALTLTSGVFLVNSNMLSVNGNINRSNGFIDASNTSATIVFGGSTAQSIPASTFTGNINNLTLSNSAGLSISQDLSVVGALTLISGKLTLGTNHLTLGETATISGTFSSSNMIIATGLGEIRKQFAQGSGDVEPFTFPIGNGGEISEYTPIVLDFASGNYGANAYVGVRVQDSKQATLNSSVTNYLNRNWIVEPNDITGFSFKIQLYYVDADFITDGSLAEGDLLPIKISSGQWYQPTDGTFSNAISQGFAGVFASSNYLEWNGLTTFSEFGGAGGNNQPLPVELLSFSSTCIDNQSVLYWQTASEYNSSHFVLEKSIDGISWHLVGQVSAAGNSNELINYTFIDQEKSNGYYRLNQVDIDGKNEYFGPIEVSCEQQSFKAHTLPNPSNTNFWIQITSDDESSAYYEIKDVKGNTVFKHQIAIQKGLNLYQVNSSLPSGMYFIHIVSENEKSLILKHLQN